MLLNIERRVLWELLSKQTFCFKPYPTLLYLYAYDIFLDVSRLASPALLRGSTRWSERQETPLQQTFEPAAISGRYNSRLNTTISMCRILSTSTGSCKTSLERTLDWSICKSTSSRLISWPTADCPCCHPSGRVCRRSRPWAWGRGRFEPPNHRMLRGYARSRPCWRAKASGHGARAS